MSDVQAASPEGPTRVSMLTVWVLIGVLLDIYSCFLFLRRNRRGYGPSGIFVVTLIIFYLLPLLLFDRSVFTDAVWKDCLLLTAFHVIAFCVPIFHQKYIAKTPKH
jgi:hypothetical protein